MAPSSKDVLLGYEAARAEVRRRLIAFAGAAWDGLGSYRDADIDRLVRIITPRVAGSQRAIQRLTDAYIAALAQEAGVGVVGGYPRHGVTPAEVYRRPGTAVYTALAEKKSLDQAVKLGRNRLISLVSTDLQLALRDQAAASFKGQGYTGYRRVLTGAENCSLCVLASTQRYHVGDLAPMHPGCDCGVSPITASSDPGQVINNDLLESLHEQIQGQFGMNPDDRGGRGIYGFDGKPVKVPGSATKRHPDGVNARYSDVMIHQHGELGPVLTWRNQKFTGPADI